MTAPSASSLTDKDVNPVQADPAAVAETVTGFSTGSAPDEPGRVPMGRVQ